MAIQENKKIAFEVHWSKQTFEETKFRQDKYKESNVRGCWFFRTAPKELRDNDSLLADKEIPAFKIFKDKNSNIIAQLKQTQLPLKSLVDGLLKRKLKFCEHIRLKPKQDVTIIFFEISCWKCGEKQHCYTVEQNLSTVCNQNFYLMTSLWGDGNNIDKTPKIYEAVQQFLKTEKGKYLKIGELKKRYSNTVQHSYLSHGCCSCDAIFGDYPLITEKLEAQNNHNNIKHTVEMDLGTEKAEGKHWCYSENGEFCE